MRLIDADKLKQIIDKKETWILELIDEEQTAYDVDKVVEELENNASRCTKKYTTNYVNKYYKDVKAISVNKAIEIVKAGGKNE